METFRILETIKQFVLFGLVCMPVEWIFALHPSSTLRLHRMADLAHGLFNAIVLRVPLALLVGVTALGSEALLPAGFLRLVAEQPLVLQVLEASLVGDFGIYAAHRLLHSRLLWRVHAIHHSAEDIDWLVALRIHPAEMLLMESLSLLPVVFLGLSAPAIGIYVLIYGWMSLLNHANVRISFGPLKWLVVGPEFHHWHHANETAAYNKNFASQFVLWDWLFGTLHMPQGRRPSSYGVNETVPAGFADQLLYPFRRRNRVAPSPAGPQNAAASLTT
jgi:sterol desaturase/sphingolipid hydroxylase (fatty acid hydroxylase superfamily)